ncbi:rod shape-determining protein RodA [uncultured Thiothrix sp.]|jgi:rod shape determining protein RodA|uniref:rod shape-determining protein RodA n=1 Tax=uncultured Thiothrix sp. TaxID=223185 RepID=UPI00261CCCAA|nr:rod shape-determining protein RodA [uncultured Thiothrix sp.]HMT91358.1 rod shape-determining protein RodA [Thiolinea sp.]
MISGLLPASLLKMLQRVDLVMLAALSMLMFMGLVTLYSASDTSMMMVYRQGIHFVLGLVLMLLFSQVEGKTLRQFAIWLYGIGVVLLILVLMVGVIKKGAQRWLYLGIDIQPAEMMKLAVPMMVAYYFSEKPLPPRFLDIIVALILVAVPMVLIMKQPDLGTSLLIALSGLFVIYLAGMSWWLIGGSLAAIAIAAPLMFNYGMHEYQRQRILTLFDPESDLLGTGYHIYQSKIAIGSGGVYGKGWLHGDQSHLDFLPERHTDFIFAVFGEEFGFLGNLLLISLYVFIIWRGLYIASKGADTFSRLLAGSLSLTFFIYLVVNTGMVSGVLPVVGIPLPLVSYGGTSVVTLMSAFGIIMGMKKRKRNYQTEE